MAKHTEQWLAITTDHINGDRTILGHSSYSPACFPLRPFFIQLPSGLRHHFESELQARECQYWPITIRRTR